MKKEEPTNQLEKSVVIEINKDNLDNKIEAKLISIGKRIFLALDCAGKKASFAAKLATKGPYN